MNTDIEYTSAVEVRASGGLLTGQAVPYGEAARDRPEMFLPGSFITGMDTAALNLQHDRSIVIAEQPKNLTFTDGLRASICEPNCTQMVQLHVWLIVGRYGASQSNSWPWTRPLIDE